MGVFCKIKFTLTKSISAFPFSHYIPESNVLLLLGLWQAVEGENARPRVERNSLGFLTGFVGKV